MWQVGVFVILSVGIAMGATAQESAEAPDIRPTAQKSLRDFQDMRFGMFIHWGPVALKGTEIGWSRGREVPVEEYDQLYKQFNPTKFDATEWVRIAKDAGMKYMVLTSKHHDGFCLWDSQYTDYDIMSTPFGRDVIAELAKACKEGGIEFGTYYSILDWYQPDYNTADSQGGPGYALPEGREPSMDRYVEYMYGHMEELITKYGPLLVMWFDGEWEEPWSRERGVRLYNYVRSLQPDILVNNRVGKGRQGMEGTTKEGYPGDFDTPEQEIGAFNRKQPWETCMTIGTQWAWKPDDTIKSLKECLRTLIRTAGGDGNLLFNVGPMPDGRIAPEQADRLRKMGAWLDKYGESIYGTRGGPYMPGDWGVSTCKGDTIYVHVFEWNDKPLVLPPLGFMVVNATQLGGGAVSITQGAEAVTLDVPKANRHEIDTIIALEIDGNAEDIPPIEP
ncbi:MAG: alpha-L-fucosidase [Candidatus Hydrogenedentota bacterium]